MNSASVSPDASIVWISIRDPFYLLGVWDSLYSGKKDPFFLPRVMWAKLFRETFEKGVPTIRTKAY